MPKVCPNCGDRFADAVALCPSDGATLRAADPGSDFIGSIVADRYVVTEALGEGGMGKVYRARHVRLPRDAAIKVLHAHMVQDPGAVARFDREAANASRIDHENVVRVFDFGETSDGLVYLAMEFVPGRTLKDVLSEDGPLTIPRAADLVNQVAGGLDAAHKLGIVHRDLKPDNVLVLPDEHGGFRCKIADFGIAKAIGSGEKSLTRTGFVIGTPEYMSPEQLLGEEVDHRSDVYSLALLAFQCLTGQTPFDSATPDRGMMARLTNQPRALSDLRPNESWPKDLQAVLNKGLDRERVRRYESAGQFAAAFARATTSPIALRQAPQPLQTPVKVKVRTPLAVPVVPRDNTPAPPAKRPAPQQAPSTPRGPVSAQIPQPARARRVLLLPRIPIVRWTVTAAVLGFGWLVLTEGSVGRATRRVKVLARNAEWSLKRLVGGAPSGAPGTVRSQATDDTVNAAMPGGSVIPPPERARPDSAPAEPVKPPVASPRVDSSSPPKRDTSTSQETDTSSSAKLPPEPTG